MLSRLSTSFRSALGVEDIPLDPGFLTKTGRIQLMYGAWVNTVQLSIGLALGFGSVVIPQLSSPESDVQITRVEASWIVSAVPLLVPLGCFISGFVMDWAGRRIMLIFCQIPMFGGWLYTAFSQTATDIIISRAITGVGCGMAMAPSRAYGTEISLPNMRGVIGAFPNLAVSLGITLTAGLDKFFTWRFLCFFCTGFTFVNFCSFIFLPETPYFLLQTKTEAQALENLILFRGNDYNVHREMDDLRDFKERNNLRKLSGRGLLRLLFTKTCIKPFMLVMAYSAIAQLAGISCILFWTIDLLQQANSSFDVQIGNFLLGITRVVMGLVTSVLLYRYGRKPLALLSAFGVAVVCGALAGVLMSDDSPTLAPQICFMLYVVFGSLGYYTLPLLVAFELYPLQVRGILGGATISMTHFMTFASTKTEPFLLDLLGIAYMFITFGVFSLLGCIFVYFWFPETKDLTLQEIEEFYKEIRSTLVSQRRLESLSRLAQLSAIASSGTFGSGYEIYRRPTHEKLEQKKKIEELLEKNKQLGGSESTSERKFYDSIKIRKPRVDDSSLKIIYEEKKVKYKKEQKNYGQLLPKEDNNRAEETADEGSSAITIRGKKERNKVKRTVKIDEEKIRKEDTQDKDRQNEEEKKHEKNRDDTQDERKKEEKKHEKNKDDTQDEERKKEEKKREKNKDDTQDEDRKKEEKKHEKNKDEETPKDEDQPSTSKNT